MLNFIRAQKLKPVFRNNLVLESVPMWHAFFMTWLLNPLQSLKKLSQNEKACFDIKGINPSKTFYCCVFVGAEADGVAVVFLWLAALYEFPLRE